MLRDPAPRTPTPTSDDPGFPRHSAAGRRTLERRPRLGRRAAEPTASVETSALSAAWTIGATTFVATAAYCWMVVTAAAAGPLLGLAWGRTGTSRGFRGL